MEDEKDDMRYCLKESLIEIFPNENLMHELVVYKKELYDSISTKHNNEEYGHQT